MLIPITSGSGLQMYRGGLGATAGQIAIGGGSSVVLGFIAGGPVGAAIAAVGVAISALLTRRGPQQNVATTNIVNDVAPLMQKNLDAWQASAKTCSDQAGALANFDSLWNAVVSSCANPSLGDPGHSCIDDRLPAGIQFEYNTFHLVGNGMYNWFAYYRDPIANDPAAQGCCPTPPCYYPNCTPASTGCVPAGGSAGGSVTLPVVGSVPMSALLIPAVLLALLWAVS